jgi:hypothetical protein
MASSKSPCPACLALAPVCLPYPAVLPRLLPMLLPALTAAVRGAACSFLGTSGQPVADLLRYSGLEDPLAVMESTLRWRHLAPTAPDTLGEAHPPTTSGAPAACHPHAKLRSVMDVGVGPPRVAGRRKVPLSLPRSPPPFCVLLWLSEARSMDPLCAGCVTGVWLVAAACYPFVDSDPFILDRCPAVYFAGNQPAFATRVLQGTPPSSPSPTSALVLRCCCLALLALCLPMRMSSPRGCCGLRAGREGQTVRLVTLPRFASSGTAVLVSGSS